MVSMILSKDPMITVCGTARDGEEAVARVKELRPDLVTMDIEMPNLDGIGAVTKLRREERDRTPIIMFSTLSRRGSAATLEALARGADDYVTKPSSSRDIKDSIKVLERELVAKIKALLQPRPAPPPPAPQALPAPLPPQARPATPPPPASRRLTTPSVRPSVRRAPAPRAERPTPPKAASRRPSAVGKTRIDLVVVASSTGGPNALSDFLSTFPADFPVGMLIVQHMPQTFTTMLAERLDDKCRLQVLEAAAGDEVLPGRVLIAPGGLHMGIERDGTAYRVFTTEDPPENSCRPAADYLFRSVAANCGSRTLSVVLTGMGYDGREGVRALRNAGGVVLAQDEASSVVWGMPGAVVEANLADEVLPLDRMGERVVAAVMGRSRSVVRT
jgi:two-component system chemotaxis response regulator CheB